MKYWKCFLYLLFIHSGFVQAQSIKAVTGTVVLPSGELPSGNLLLLNAVDSSLLQGQFFVDGIFKLENVPQQTLLLRLTSLEFRDTLISLPTINQPTLNLGLITVLPDDLYLGEVLVKNTRPTYVQKSNGTVEVIIENTVLSASNSVNEILSKSPEVTIDEDGIISVFGKGAAIIFLNKQRITSDQLALISPTEIRSIEIIRNPSAMYDAEGGAVILINTLRSGEDGINTRLGQNAEYSPFAGWKTFSTANLNLQFGKFLSRAFTTFSQGKDKFFKGTTRDRAPENIFISSDLATNWRPNIDYDFRYGFGAQWILNSSSFISLDYSGFKIATSGITNSTNTITTDNLLGIYDVDILRNEEETNHSLSLNLEQELDTLGSVLFVGGQYSDFYSGVRNPIFENSIENGLNNSRELFNVENRDITIMSGQVDYTQVLKPNISIGSGIKYSYVENESKADFLVAEPPASFILDPNLSNLFAYQEQVSAAYVQWSHRINQKWNYELGVRLERTAFTLEFNEASEQIENRYVNTFPSASIEFNPSEQYQFNLAYRASINRQDYNRLNPGLIYQDPYTSIQGNPFLLPQRLQSLELISKLKRMTVKLGYNYIEDPFSGAAIPGLDELSYILIRLNLNRRQSYYASLSRNFSSKFWSSSITLSQYYEIGEESEVGLIGKSPIPHWYVYTVNRVKVGKLFDLEALFWAVNEYRDGTINRTPSWNLTLSIEKSFFDQALRLRLIVNDVFHSQRADGNYTAGVTDITFRNKWNSNYFRLAMSYNFGRLKGKGYKNKAIGKDQVKRIR